jgi:hypothetical protein
MGLEIADAGTLGELKGDVPGLGRLVVTDTESGGKDRWTVIVGGQSRYVSDDPTALLFYEAEDFTALATSTKTAGATGASGSGSNVVRNTDLTTTYQAVLKSELDTSNAALTHKGTYRVWARLYRPTANNGAVSARLEWAEGDYTRVTQNDPVDYAVSERPALFTWANLGIVTIDPSSTRWEFRLLAKSTVAGDELDVDCFALIPTEVVYTELSALRRFETPTSFAARDEFDQSAGNLTGKTAPVGGNWAGAGDADDFAVETFLKTAQRTAVSDGSLSTGRFVTVGSAATTQAVQADVFWSTVDSGLFGVLFRYVDANNTGIAWLNPSGTPVGISKLVGGSLLTIASAPSTYAVYPATFYTLRVVVDTAGRVVLWYGPTLGASMSTLYAQDTVFATGGTLDDGKPGLYDAKTGAAACTRGYNNFLSFAPTSDAAIFAGQSLSLEHDGATREDSAGSFSSKVSDRRGRYLKVPPSGPEGRSTRLAVLALPNDPYTFGDAPAVYDLSAQLFVTPRGLVVPEA